MEALLSESNNFFAGEPNLVQVFDIDYDLLIGFKCKKQSIGVGVCLPCATLCCVPCFLKKTIEWTTLAKHVALTEDGIKYVSDKHPAGCGCPCQDVGKVSKTVPYDKITDCDIEEPAGTACCCCIRNVITKVNIDTASSGQFKAGEAGPMHELVLEGLKEPHEFKKMVWDMKSGRHGAVQRAPADVMQNAPVQQDMNTVLLQKIYDEMRRLNTNMEKTNMSSHATLLA